MGGYESAVRMERVETASNDRQHARMMDIEMSRRRGEKRVERG